MEENGFELLANEEEQLQVNDAAAGFFELYNESEKYFSEQKAALNSTTLLTALALSDKRPITDELIGMSRDLLEKGQEAVVRGDIANQRLQRQMASINRVQSSLNVDVDPQIFQGLNASYNKLKTWDMREKQRVAIEEAAVDRIRSMAMEDPVQARILMDQLEFGTADQVTADWAVKMAVLRQRAEELDEEYQTMGWGKWLLNTVLNLAPLNFNFQRTGVMGTAGVTDLFTVGSSQQEESDAFWQQAQAMSNEEFARYAAKDGPLMESVRDNATTLFDLTADPQAAVEILDNIMATGSSTRQWNNVWGGVEIASVAPWKTLTNTTRMIAGMGDVRGAVRNMDNALHVLDTQGPEAMTRATGVTERELADELTVSAAKASDDGDVPLSVPAADRRAAAQLAIDEFFNSPDMPRFFSTEEAQVWMEGRIKEIEQRIGSPVKDVNYTTESLPGGQSHTSVTFTIGRKDGLGFASAGAARRAANSYGFGGSAEVAEEIVERPVVFLKNTDGTEITFYHGTAKRFEGMPTKGIRSRPNFVVYSTEADVANSYADLALSSVDDGTSALGDNRVFPVNIKAEDIADFRNPEDLEKARQWHVNRVNRENEEASRPAGWGESSFSEDALKNGDWTLWENEDMLRANGWKGAWITERNLTRKNPELNLALLDAEVNAVSLFDEAGRTFRDSTGQYFVKITRDMPEAGWLTGELKPEQMGFLGRMISRWFSSAARTGDPTLHGMALEAGSYLNRAARHIDNEIMGVFRQLPGKSKKVVRALGHLSAKREQWLTEEQIHVAVERGFGRRATEAELNAYKDLRLFNDMDWELRNVAMYVDGITKGKETVSFTTRWGEDILDEDVKIDYNMEVTPVERVFDVSRNKHYVHGRNSLDTKTLTTMKNNGYVMMTFPEGFTLPEGVIVNKVLIKKSDVTIKPLKREQLAYAPGGHRMYTDRVFVKQGRKGRQVDTGTEYLLSPNTFRTASNIAEAKKWAAVMERARTRLKEDPSTTAQQLDDEVFMNNTQSFPSGQEFLDGVTDGLYNLDNPFEAVFDRDLPSMYNTSGVDVTRMFNEDELGINGYYRTTGRMYTSAKGEILRHTSGEVAEILDPYETLSRSLHQVTRQLGLYNYKVNALERFANTYAKWLDVDATKSSPVQVLTDAKVVDTAPAEIRNQIEAQRASILNVLRFETPADRHTRQMYQSLAEKVLGEGDNAFRKFGHDAVWWFKDNNPVSVLRGLAFDMKLGMFNPGQLLVQASTMFSATALSPKYGMMGMSGLMPMHAYILKRGSENILDTMVKRGVPKVMGFDSVDEFKEYARHAYRHGFMEMNGSHIMINNTGPNVHFGSFAEKQTRAREQARVFFYTSEIWNRLVAYRIAWGEARDRGLRATDPQFNATILKLADDYSFNMTNESAAFWQKGLLSIPTQFWAYNMRMIEAMFGNRFTPMQRIRLGTMQLGIAGTAGIPGLQALSEYIKQKHGQAPNIDSLTGLADRGLVDYINYQLTGQDVLIGERVGTGGWASDTVKAIFGASEYGAQSFDELLGGATWNITKKTSQTLWDLGKYAVAESGDEQTFGSITKENMLNVLKEVSTFGNTAKAIMIHQHGILKSNSGTVQASGLPEGNAIYQALSFRPAKADEMSYMMAYRQDKAEAVREWSTKLRNWRQEAITTGDYETYWKKANVIINLIPYEDRREVLRNVNRTMDQSYYDFLERKVSEEQTDAALIEQLDEGNE